MKNMLVALALSWACITMSGCASSPGVTQPAGAYMAGWLDGNCLAIHQSGLEKGTRLTVMSLGEKSTRHEAIIAGPAIDAASCNAIRAGRKAVNAAEGNSFYRIQSDQPIELGIGLLQANARADHVALNVDMKTDAFAYCLSSEGIHYSIWSGAPYQSKRLWHAYEYLGYDTQPDCPDGAF